MTVAELIENLAALDPRLPVVLAHPDTPQNLHEVGVATVRTAVQYPRPSDWDGAYRVLVAAQPGRYSPSELQNVVVLYA